MGIESELKIHSVVACCNSWGIGNKGKLPWHLPQEYKYFARCTTGNPPEGRKNAVILGRKTWDSIPKKFQPLKNRINIVISRSEKKELKGMDAVVGSLEELIELLQDKKWSDRIHEVYNAGGVSIYDLIHNSPYCGTIFLTRILADFECDTFLTPLDDSFYQVPVENYPQVPQGIQEENGVQWKVEVYKKKPSA